VSLPERGRDGPTALGAGGAEQLLRARARELAFAREEESADLVPLLPLEAGGERYAVEVTRVHQVVDARRVDPLLGAPRGVIGAVVSRTRPVPVFDLRHVLGLRGGGLQDLHRVVVVDDDGDLYGVAVERVAPRLEVPRSDLRPAGPGPFRWVTPDRMAVLDPSRLGAELREGS
jgi:purine-binding chemotaxis protein CheW